MEGVLVAIAVLACPLGMGLMGWFMVKGMRRDKQEGEGEPSLDHLRAEHERLGAEIEQLEARRDEHQPAA